jgi:hypothetical protein
MCASSVRTGAEGGHSTRGFSGHPTPPAAADPVRGNLQSALDPLRSKDEINLTIEFERNKVANYACPITRLAWS